MGVSKTKTEYLGFNSGYMEDQVRCRRGNEQKSSSVFGSMAWRNRKCEDNVRRRVQKVGNGWSNMSGIL